MIKKLKEVLNATEIYTLAMLVIYTIFSIIFWNGIDGSHWLLLQNLGIICLILAIAVNSNRNPKLESFRKFYLIPFVFVIYNQVHAYIPMINPHDYDTMLIKWDFALFGVNPTEWIYKYSHPVLTEYLQFCYMTFFLMPIAHGIEWHLRKEEEKFSTLIRQILLGFYVSYLLYFFMPAIGPRFCVHDFSRLAEELPGLWLTEGFRAFINSGGGIPSGTVDPAVFVNRDCMPSGHTMMTLMNMWIAFKFRSNLRYIFLIIGTSLIISTVYLRYHYIVDVLAGVFFAALVLYMEPKLKNFLKGLKAGS